MFDDLGDGGVGLTATGVLIGFIGYVTRMRPSSAARGLPSARSRFPEDFGST